LDAITALLMTNVDIQVLKLPLSQQIHKLILQLLKVDTNGILQLLEIRSWQAIALSGKTYENNLERIIPPSVPSIGYFIPD
jgi:hypothetical protein